MAPIRFPYLIITGLAAVGLSTLTAASVAAQAPATAWDSVGTILQTAAAATGGYQRFNFPRRDITLHVRDVTVAPALALGGWLGFAGSPSAAMVMGDLVLLGDELGPALSELNTQGIEVSAIHNHIVGEPQVTYVHVHASGNAIELARKFDRVLARTKTPRPVTAAPSPPVTIDSGLVFRTLGLAGRAQGAVAQMSVVLPMQPVLMGGMPLLGSLAYSTPINVQMIDAGRYVATGDFSVLESRVQPVISALARNGITATAVHSHLIGESPRVYYIHFWADGAPAAVLTGLRAALDAGR
jgi:hypothetical protein